MSAFGGKADITLEMAGFFFLRFFVINHVAAPRGLALVVKGRPETTPAPVFAGLLDAVWCGSSYEVARPQTGLTRQQRKDSESPGKLRGSPGFLCYHPRRGCPTLKGLFLVLMGLGVGIAVLAIVWNVVNKSFGTRRLVIDDLDIYRSANELIKLHGDDATIHAAMRADELLEAGDLDGQAVWKRIIKAVDELLSKERPEGESLH